ncbi:nf-x1-like transcription factor [Nannochloropsis gaditana]|uniref:Nf-x1-like transcription factor n=1 Tax=Nannochloropsis gaditana TaxID=72520 RepID=W7TJM4_9STRA|nr:nf-x1-like transcription factor [Nannochloropsis gaditana]
MLTRNRRFAEALGIAKAVQGQALTLAQVRGEEGGEGGQEMDAFRLELERPVYPRELLDWAISPATKMDVLRLERKIAAFLSDKKEASLYLKPMAKEERRRVHLLAEFYGLRSLSYDNEPRRFVALIKAPAVGPSGDNSSAGGLPGPTGARAPVVLLSEAAAAEVLARRHTGAHSNGSSAHSGASLPLAPLLTPPLPPSSASLLVANIGELSGKTVTDRLRCLYPALPLLGYHFREPPPDASPRLEPFPPALVVHLGSVQALAALLDEAKARPADLHPFVLKASLGGASVVIRPVAPPPGTKAAKGGNLEPPQGQSSAQDGQQRWGSSVLPGRLKPRSLPPPSSTVSSSSSPLSSASTPHKVAETRSTTIGALLATGSHVNKQRGRTKGGNAGHEGGKLRGGGARSDQVELQPGQGIASNRWAWLEMDGDDGDSEEEEEEREEEEEEHEEEEEEKQERKEEEKECRAGADKGFNRDGVRDGGAETDREGNRREGMKTTALSMDERVGDGTEGIGVGEEGEEEEEWEEEELEVACSACTFKHLCDYCPMCMTPRPTGR